MNYITQEEAVRREMATLTGVLFIAAGPISDVILRDHKCPFDLAESEYLRVTFNNGAVTLFEAVTINPDYSVKEIVKSGPPVDTSP